jgi:hypothetical protein
MKFRFFSSGAWDIRSVSPPWGERPSIYQHIQSHIRGGEPGLGENGNALPDEELVRGDKEVGWAPGALDGVMGHHASKNEALDIANEILESLRALTKKASKERASSLYSLLLEHPTLSYVDHLLEAVVAHHDLDGQRVHAIAHWLAMGAPDREPLKCAIALLGVCGDNDDRDLLLTLGRHEEFTLFVAVALGNSADEAELSLYALACLVTGWGRIQIIERLANTKDEQIKAWLLREGYRNDVLNDYTAPICAKTGDLLTALRQPDPDDKLLKGAGSILSTLMQGEGGPVEGMSAYPDGPEATELYLTHLQTRSVDVQGLVDVHMIAEFLKKESSAEWLERRAKLLELTDAILSRSGWEEKIRSELVSEDYPTFWRAAEAARRLNVDVWDIYFERLQRGDDVWFYVMQTRDRDRIDRVIAFAEETLPLNEITSGPTESVGLGPEFKHHSALDFVLQELQHFPGKGWKLIRAGLQSPTVRNRNMALMALSAWDRSTWPDEVEPLLRQALEVEPQPRTRAKMIGVLGGE